MSAAIALQEIPALFADFHNRAHVILAVSGGVDSTALMLLAARWREQSPQTRLTVASIDHALRPESAEECRAVSARATDLGLPCIVKRWESDKPAARLQEAARGARYSLLTAVAAELGADAIATAHTLDDQAETVLMRLLHGSAVDGLAAMRPSTALKHHIEKAAPAFSGGDAAPTSNAPIPTSEIGSDAAGDLSLLRPLLGTTRARLVATLQAAGMAWLEDPSNRNPRFERVRLRALLAQLAPLGLDPARLALLARRAARSSDALEAVAAERFETLARREQDRLQLDGPGFAACPADIRLRILERAVLLMQDTGKMSAYGLRLERLEALAAALDQALDPALGQGRSWQRSLGGTLLRLDKAGNLQVTREPERRRGAAKTKM